MDSLNFNIYGYRIKISSVDYPLNLLKVCSDFKFFADTDVGKSNLQIKIQKLHNFRLRGFAIGKTSMCQVRQVSMCHRQLVYRKDDQTLALVDDTSDTDLRIIEISAANAAIIDDVLYFIINSCSGEYLDRKGLMRIHALSFSTPGRGGVVYGFPGAGKSTVAVGLLQNVAVRIFSDEVSIFDIHNQVLLPFPIRLAVSEISDKAGLATKFTYFFNTKYLISLESEKIAQSRSLTHFHFLDNSKRPVLYYLISIVLGIGLIQMWEYFVRFNNLPSLFRIAFNRLKLCRLLGASQLSYLNHQLNKDIKFRESFRPYGCSTLHEKSHTYFEVPENFENPYMSFATKVRAHFQKLLSEVSHVDGTSRMQTVRITQNKLFHELIQKFGNKTDLYVLLNTSLNVMGEPIVESLADARNFVDKVPVYGLAVGEFFVRRK